MKISYPPKKWFTISSLIFLLIMGCKVSPNNNVSISKRGEREAPTVFLLPGVKSRYYYLDGTNAIHAYRDTNKTDRFDTVKVEFTPVKQRRNWINDSVRYLPVINGVDRLDTVRNRTK